MRRGDLARAVIEGGWDLNEMRPATLSLEEIFLRLTGSEPAGEAMQEENAPTTPFHAEEPQA